MILASPSALRKSATHMLLTLEPCSKMYVLQVIIQIQNNMQLLIICAHFNKIVYLIM
jgi:hypothetical protein